MAPGVLAAIASDTRTVAARRDNPMNQFIPILVAMVGGIAVAMQAKFIGLMDQRMGTLESVFVTYGLGSVLATGLICLARGGNLKHWSAVPWYALTAGFFGLIIVLSISYTVPRLGLVSGLTLLTASQYAIAVVIDHYGLFESVVRPLDAGRVVGLGLLLSGVWLIVR